MRQLPYEIPENKRIRLIISTDCFCEADDQYALAHLLMTPKIEVVGILAEHYSGDLSEESEQKSYEEIHRILSLMGLEGSVPVCHGSPCAMRIGTEPLESEAAELLVREACAEDTRPLFVTCQSALTNIASAYLKKPEIADKITLLWVGGGAYPEGGFEFNLMNDVHAANVVLGSGMEVWQFPQSVYSQMSVPFAVLQRRVGGCGDIGRYLVQKVYDTNRRMSELLAFPGMRAADIATSYPGGESWSLGDSAPIGALLGGGAQVWHMEDAPAVAEDGKYKRQRRAHRIRVYDSVDRDFIMDDFYAKLSYHFG